MDYAALASAAESALRGLELCARRTRVPTISVAVTNAASGLRALLHAIEDAAQAIDAAPAPRLRTGKVSERLRWEWLASTAVVLDGPRGVEHRLLDECARILGDGLPHTRGRAVDPVIAARYRVASAEAHSLAETAPRESGATLAVDPLRLPALI